MRLPLTLISTHSLACALVHSMQHPPVDPPPVSDTKWTTREVPEYRPQVNVMFELGRYADRFDAIEPLGGWGKSRKERAQDRRTPNQPFYAKFRRR